MTVSFGGPVYVPPKPALDHSVAAANIRTADATVKETNVLLDKIREVRQYVEALEKISDVVSDVGRYSYRV